MWYISACFELKVLKVEVSGHRRGKCLSMLTGCRSSMSWGMSLWVGGGLVGAVLHVRSMLSCRLWVCICFKAVSSSLYGKGAFGSAIGNCATGLAYRLQSHTGDKVGSVSFMPLTTFSSISATGGAGCTVLFIGGRPRLLFLGMVWLRSIGGNAVDLFWAITADGSLKILTLRLGPLVAKFVLNRMGIAIF